MDEEGVALAVGGLSRDAAAEERAAEARRLRIARAEIARSNLNVTKISVLTLAILAVLAAAYVAEEILLPLVLAWLLSLLLQPARRFLSERLHIPAPLTALLLVLVLMAVVGGIGFAISVPASSWAGKAPSGFQALQDKLAIIKQPLDFLRHGFANIQHMMAQQPSANGGAQPLQVQQSQDLGGIGLVILSHTGRFLSSVFTTVIVLFFLLTAGDNMLRRIVEITPTFRDKRRVVEISQEIERNISAYLITITIINAVVGVATGLAMWLIGIPDALLWGTLAFLLNYIPILGPLTGVVIFFFVGLFTLSSFLTALIPAGAYLAIHMVEGETITPILVARRFTLNPVFVIVSLFLWDWFWGTPGALLSLPILAVFKIVCDRIEPLMAVGHLLGSSDASKPERA